MVATLILFSMSVPCCGGWRYALSTSSEVTVISWFSGTRFSKNLKTILGLLYDILAYKTNLR